MKHLLILLLLIPALCLVSCQPDGIPGKDGRDGIDGKNGVDGLPGKDGLPGQKGADGLNGVCPNCPPSGGGTAVQATFNVMSFSAVGDGVHDDTQAFQNAFNAAIAARGKVLIPAPPNHYKLTNTIVVWNQQSGQAWIDVEGWGWGVGADQIKWYGPSNKPIFQLIGLKQGMWNGLKVGIPPGVSGVTIFDVDTRNGANSTTGVTFKNMYLSLGTMANVAFRLGHESGGNGDVSNLQFENIAIYGKQFDVGGPVGQIAYLHEGRNTLSLTWIGGFVAHCDKIYSNVSGAGAKDDRGNGSVYFYGLGASQNNVDFEINFEQTYLISGGRFESSHKFMHVKEGGGYASITVQNATIHDSHQEGNFFDIDTAVDLNLIGVHVVDTDFNDSYSQSLINLNSASRPGRLFVSGGLFSSNTLYTKTGTPQWDITVLGAAKSQGVWSQSFFTNEIGVRK